MREDDNDSLVEVDIERPYTDRSPAPPKYEQLTFNNPLFVITDAPYAPGPIIQQINTTHTEQANRPANDKLPSYNSYMLHYHNHGGGEETWVIELHTVQGYDRIRGGICQCVRWEGRYW